MLTFSVMTILHILTARQLFQWKKLSVTMHMVLGLILLLSSVCDGLSYINCGNHYNGSNGTITSPNYPSSYPSNANCTYILNAHVATNITLIFQLLDTEYETYCSFDWVQITCKSHVIGPSTRYCGRNKPLYSITLSPCKQVEVIFHSDSSVTGSGFSIFYQVDRKECPDNCTLVTNADGFGCTCDKNETDIRTSTPPTSRACSSSCYLSRDNICICPVSYTIATTLFTCPPGCYASSDFYGYRSCNCNPSTTPRCASGCYRTTDWRGTSYCSCPSTTARPLNCGYGCYQDSDYFDRPFCNCPSSTRPPLYCSSGCYSRLDSYGYRYCYCPTTTLPPCYSPCYYTYDSRGRRSCYCHPNATLPSIVCGNRYYNDLHGIIVSPNYPFSYPNLADCTYIIAANVPGNIILTFEHFDMEYNGGCTLDWVQVTCTSPMMGRSTKYCRLQNIPYSITLSQCDQVVVLFHSDYSATGSGFSIYYQVAHFDTDTYLPPRLKIGIGVGVGMGGLFLILLVILIINSIVACRRRAARNERHPTEELSTDNGSIRLQRSSQDGNHGTTAAEGFTNLLIDLEDNLPRDPPPYTLVEEASDSNTPEDTNDEVMLLA